MTLAADPLPGPIPPIEQPVPVKEPEPDRLPDEEPLPNPDENPEPPQHVGPFDTMKDLTQAPNIGPEGSSSKSPPPNEVTG